jgi:hypothetical protein
MVAIASQAGLMGSGCAHRGAPDQVVEAAYADARAAGAACRPGDAACCAKQVAAARAGGDSGRAAHLWQEVALACPDRRAEVRAALAGGTVARPSPGAGAHLLNVSYRARLSPAFRLFWVATAVGPHLLPSSGPASSTEVEVEVQAIRFTGTRAGPLLVVSRRFDLAFEPTATVIVEIADAAASSPSPLEVTAHLDKVPLPRGPRAQVSPPRPMPAPRLEKARAVAAPPLRAPLELAGLQPPALRLCLDREGHLDTIRFLEPLHPRFAASLIDMYRDSRYDPYRVNDLAVPSCQVLTAPSAPR